MLLGRDESGQEGLLAAIGVILILVGILALVLRAWSLGLALLGVGFLLTRVGGEASYDSPIGTVTGGAGLILIIVAVVLWYYFHL